MGYVRYFWHKYNGMLTVYGVVCVVAVCLVYFYGCPKLQREAQKGAVAAEQVQQTRDRLTWLELTLADEGREITRPQCIDTSIDPISPAPASEGNLREVLRPEEPDDQYKGEFHDDGFYQPHYTPLHYW